MIGILAFDLDEPDDKLNFEKCSNANNMAMALWDIKQKLREIIKYAQFDQEAIKDEKVQDFAVKFADFFYECIDENGLTNLIECG